VRWSYGWRLYAFGKWPLSLDTGYWQGGAIPVQTLRSGWIVMHHAELHSGEANKPRLPLARADLPQEVMALALRLDVKADHPTNRVQLTQIGQMRLAPASADRPFFGL
jgi:hypothetical protein